MPQLKRSMQVRETATSLVLSFPYDPVLVRLIRAVPGRLFDPTTRTWSIPKTSRAMRTLWTFMRAQNVGGHERVERILLRELPRPTELWWAGDLPEAS